MSKKAVLCTIVGLFVASSLNAKDFKNIEGTFVKISSGDFTHLEILDKNNKLWDFWCGDMPLSPSASKTIECSDIQVAPEKYKNKKMLVEYKAVEKFVQEAQEKIKRNEVEKIYLK